MQANNLLEVLRRMLPQLSFSRGAVLLLLSTGILCSRTARPVQSSIEIGPLRQTTGPQTLTQPATNRASPQFITSAEWRS